MKDYDAHYRDHKDVTAQQLYVDVAWLRDNGKFEDIERAITAYLKYHGVRAEPWMYDLLALAMEKNKRDPNDVKIALGWAGFLAQKRRDPLSLMKTADTLLLRKIWEVELPAGASGEKPVVRTGDLLDQAIELAPHRPEAHFLSIRLGELSQDPKRMSKALDAFLSLGWPGKDEVWRLDAHKQAQALAKTLRAAGKLQEASSLLEQLAQSETRDLFIRLTWEGDAWISLSVDEPLGARCDHASPRTVFGGALVKEGRGKDREVVYVCPRGFDGQYIITPQVLSNDQTKPVTKATLEIITHEGSAEEKLVTKSVTLAKPEPVKIQLAGGRRRRVLPYSAPIKIQIDPKKDADKPSQPGAPAAPKGAAPTSTPEKPRAKPIRTVR